MQEIGNALGEFIKVAEETKLCRYTSYARMCVYMDLKQAFPDTVSLFHDDIEWIQMIDYEHVPFRCRKCHDLGHLFRDCPLNRKPPTQMDSDKPTSVRFTKVVNRRRGHKKSAANTRTIPANPAKPSTRNSFVALDSTDIQEPKNPPSKEKETSKEKLEETSPMPRGSQISKSIPYSQIKNPAWGFLEMEVDNPAPSSKTVEVTSKDYQEPQLMEEDPENIDIGELDILGLEQACKTGNFDKIPDRQVDNLVEVLTVHKRNTLLGYRLAVRGMEISSPKTTKSEVGKLLSKELSE